MKRLNGWQRLWVVLSSLVLALSVAFAAVLAPTVTGIAFAVGGALLVALLLYVSARSVGWIVDGFRQSSPAAQSPSEASVTATETVDGSPANAVPTNDQGPEWLVRVADTTRCLSGAEDVRAGIARGDIPADGWVHHRSFDGWISPREFRLRFPTTDEKRTLRIRAQIALLGAGTIGLVKASAAGKAHNMGYLLGAFLGAYLIVGLVFLVAWPFRSRRNYPSERLLWNTALVILCISAASLPTAMMKKENQIDSPDVRAEKLLMSAPIFAEVAALDTAAYARIKAQIANALAHGDSAEIAARSARPELAALFRRELPRASDDALLAYMAYWTNSIKHLQQIDVEQCYDVGFQGRVRDVTETPEQQEQRLQLMTNVLRSARQFPVATFDDHAARQLLSRSINEIATKGFRLDVVGSDTADVSVDQKRLLCDATVKLHEHIMTRTKQEAALVYRHLNSR